MCDFYLDATIIDYDQSVFMSDAEQSLFVSSCDYPIEYNGWNSCNYSVVNVTECSRLAVRCEKGKDTSPMYTYTVILYPLHSGLPSLVHPSTELSQGGHMIATTLLTDYPVTY